METEGGAAQATTAAKPAVLIIGGLGKIALHTAVYPAPSCIREPARG